MATVSIEVVADLEEIRPHSPEWHRLRRLGIGGSDAAAIAGLSRWNKTPYSVWVDKTSEALPEPEENEPEYLTWGKILEAPVRDEFSRRTGIEVTPFPRMVRNTDHPFMLANVDGLTGPVQALEGVYEGKTSRKDWLDGGEVEVPIEYAIQGQHYLAVLGLDVVHYACLVGGQALRVAEIERNDKLIDDLIAIESAFWEKYVVGELVPPVQAADKAALSKQWYGGGAEVELSEEVVAALQRRATLTAEIDKLILERDDCDTAVMAALGDATVGTWNGSTVVTWKPQSRTSIDTQGLRKAHPALAAEFSKTSSFRRFLPKEIQP